MKVEGQGIVVNIKKVQEKFALLFVFSREHGLVKGLSRISTSKKNYKTCKGDFVKFAKSTRLADHLGLFQLELIKSSAPYTLTNRVNLAILESVLAQLSHFFHEGDVATNIYTNLEKLIAVLESGGAEAALKAFVEFEIFMLAEIGYGIDFSKCAATGERDNLYYISPKSGCAVSKDAGEPYKDKLFEIPRFLRGDASIFDIKDIENALTMVEFFLGRADINAAEKFKLKACLTNEELLVA